MDLNDPELNLNIEYPCSWTYKIIGTSEEQLRLAIIQLFPGQPYELTFSNRSASGKYCSLNLEVTVESQEARLSIFDTLKSHPHIKMVL